MKKIIIAITAAALMITPARADPLQSAVEMHNRYRNMTAAAELTGTGKPDGGSGYTFDVNTNIQVTYYADDNGEITSAAVACYDESDAAEFLAQCVTIVYNLGGIEAGLDCYGPVLRQYMQARIDQPDEPERLPGIILKLAKETFGFYFLCSQR